MRYPFIVALILSGLAIRTGAAPPEETVVNLDDVEWSTGFADGVATKSFAGELVRMHVARYEKDAVSPRHSHVNEQIILVQSGRYRVSVEDRIHTLEAGHLIIIPAYASHTLEALEDSTHIEAFAPATLRPRSP